MIWVTRKNCGIFGIEKLAKWAKGQMAILCSMEAAVDG